ncbi:MAG: class I SAM-dependent methyltransferase [Gemmatirosa sp.]
MNSIDYHLGELAIALDPTRPEHLMPMLGPQHRRVLDVGCGAGQSLVASGFAEPRDGYGGWGVDVDVGALVAGRERWPLLPLAAARGEVLPFADRSFDLVLSRVALPYMDIPRALREFHRVLRPGGEVWLALHPWRMALGDLRGALRRRALKAAIFRSYVLANGAVFQATGRTLAFPIGARPTESWQGAAGMRRALRQAGFSSVAVERARGAFVTRASRSAPT